MNRSYCRNIGLFLSSILVAGAVNAGAVCKGKWVNPVSDLNWNNSLPITISGIKSPGDGYGNPPLMSMPAIVMCKSPSLGVPVPSLGITMWTSDFIAEVAKTGGCFSTMGGEHLFPQYSLKSHAAQTSMDEGLAGRTAQVHWYRYPVMALLSLGQAALCLSVSSFELTSMTEIDATWSNDAWAAASSGWGALFTGMGNLLMGAVDGMYNAATGYGLDVLPMVMGTWGPVPPLTGSAQAGITHAQANLQILGKYIFNKHQNFALFTRIGPWAKCNAVILPTWIKSQYRINPIAPLPVNSHVTIGRPEIIFAPVMGTNYPGREDAAYAIWSGIQCAPRI